jgi:ferredoxin-nitrite reductase
VLQHIVWFRGVLKHTLQECGCDMTLTDTDFTDEQKNYLEGFAAGSGLTRSLPLAVLGTSAPAASAPQEIPTGPDSAGRAAQDRFIADGKKLCTEEQAKRKLNGLDTWDLVLEHANDTRFPKGTDVFLMKFQGLFYVAPTQDAFMCRLRFPGGIASAHQFRGVADLAERFAGGYADATTRSNLQLREIGPANTADMLMGLHDLGIINRGAGADNVRNITASPTAGIDPDELIDTRPLARAMHHYILNHRDLYGLPRKFNIAFEGGGRVSALEDTNDIGFAATRLIEDREPSGSAAGCATQPVYFRLHLGGITGHKDFARDTGVLLTPAECVPVSAAILRVFLEHGDRTDRKKARLKYLLDQWGFDKFLAETEKKLGRALKRVSLDACESRQTKVDPLGHVGFHRQKQPGLCYVGVVLPVGRMTAAQMRGLADIAQEFGSGTLRLTVWQNLLISDIPQEIAGAVKRRIEALGLHWSATNVRAGLVACTGNAGCKYAAANTKADAMRIAGHLEQVGLTLDRPINIHLTGCHHSCAQHFIGDVGLIATKVTVGDDAVEGYHVHVGGGFGTRQAIGRELFRDVVASDTPQIVERMLRAYLANRASAADTFQDFVKDRTVDSLRELFDCTVTQ